MVSVVWVFHSSGYVMVVLELDKGSPLYSLVCCNPQDSICFRTACKFSS